MSWTLCTSGAAMAKSGLTEATVTASTSGALLADWSDEAESILSNITRTDLPTEWSNLNATAKVILTNLCSNHIGQKIAMYNRNEYSGQREFETILDIIENDLGRGFKLIEDDKYKTFIGAT